MNYTDEPENPDWSCVADAKAYFSETPLWSPAHDALFWIDTDAPTLNMTGGSASRSWPLPQRVGGFALHPDHERALVALTEGLYDLEFAKGTLRRLVQAPFDAEHYLFNDGRCDARGRYWTGTLRVPTSDKPDGSGFFYRFDERGLSAQIDDVTIANGLAFSPDSRTMYMADRPRWQILAFDYDLETGTASSRRQFASVPVGWRPDGAAVDRDGGYWVAMFAVGRIARFTPDGTLDRLLRAPTTNPTMVAFGGPDLATLYVTSSWANLSEAQRAREPLAGGVFACRPGQVGLAEPELGPWYPSLRPR